MDDLFGFEQPTESPRVKTEVFDLENDLSPGERYIVADALIKRSLDITDSKKSNRIMTEAERYRGCGSDALSLQCSECGTKYLIRTACRSRICERCGRIYYKKLQEKMVPLIREVTSNKKKGYLLALLTLTVKTDRWGDGMPERDQIVRLYRETSTFLRLHYGKYKSRLSKSGKVVEVKRKKKNLAPGQPDRIFYGSGWIAVLEFGKDNNNAHCHALVYGPYRPQSALSESWLQITGDSNGVDIRPARSPKEVAGYILKYITKPPQTDSYYRIADYAITIKGTRRLRTGGIFYNKIKLEKLHKERCSCILCNSRLIAGVIDSLAKMADHIDYWAEMRRIQTDRASGKLPQAFEPKQDTPCQLPLWHISRSNMADGNGLAYNPSAN
jgi:hypothetical protein